MKLAKGTLVLTAALVFLAGSALAADRVVIGEYFTNVS